MGVWGEEGTMTRRVFGMQQGWAGLALSLTVLLGGDARGSNEAVAYGVSNFDSLGECGPALGDRPNMVTMSTAFHNQFTTWKNQGLWDKATLYTNKQVAWTDWTDASKLGGGADSVDPDGADHADVAFLATHAGRKITGGRYYSEFVMGYDWDGSVPGCRLYTDSDALWGNSGGDLEIVVTFGCQSADYAVWKGSGNNRGYDPIRTTDGAFSTYLGFHGNSVSSNSDSPVMFKSFVAQSLNNGIGDNWVDFLHDISGNTQCPTAIIFGSSSDLHRSMYDFGGFADRKNTGQNTGSTFFYIKGCAPQGSAALPS